mmetsp:Transcript_3820/g.9650  ORF Transcript_3820/g.9650 Transcript_3820/m.9650 type:complete len:405 (-) Transcript_3820:41-1255(-)
MSEGGQLPWKRQKAKPAPSANYQDLLRPLPEPPSGLTWVCGEAENGGGREWYLVDTREEEEAVFTSNNAVAAVAIADSGGGVVTNDNDNGGQVPVVILQEEAQNQDNNSTPFATPGEIGTTAVVVDGQAQDSEDSKMAAGDTAGTKMVEVSLPKATLVDDVIAIASNNVVTAEAPPMAASPSVVAATSTATMNQHQQQQKRDNVDDNRKLASSSSPTKSHPQYGEYQVDYTEHIVLPSDTLQGLCLAYKISRRELQRANHFFGDSLQLAPSTLIIPITKKARQVGWQPQKKNSRDFQMAALGAECPTLTYSEVKCYLETNGWDLQQAISEATQDLEWEKQNQAEIARHEQLHQKVETVVAAAKSSLETNVGELLDNDDDNEDCCFGLGAIFAARAPTYTQVESY